MTTSERETRPAEGTADNTATAPGSDLSSPGETRGDAQERAPLTGTIAAAPDDARQLEQEIERTREQLGETVQELFARADVVGRARAKATEVSGKYKSTLVQARSQAAIRAGRMRSQVAGSTAAGWQKATTANRAGKDQLRSRVAAAGAPVWEAMPEQVRRTLRNGASGARQHWMALAIGAGVVIVGCLAVRQWVVQPSSATRYEIRVVGPGPAA